jgi:predicted RNA binding protein YcfA (HicA-like mRNA interferase family)
LSTEAPPTSQNRQSPALRSEYGQGCSDISRTQRDGWIEIRCTGSHRALVKGDQQRIWAYHDGVDLGSPAMARIARDYGYTVDELRKL